jgi:hypothetical protein
MYDAEPTPEALLNSTLQGTTEGQFVQDPVSASIRQKTLTDME